VKIELGARSDTEPSATPEIAPYLAEAFPDEVPDSPFTVHAVALERTFWAKVALLHEETYREGLGAPKARLARHYYDLWCLITGGVAERAARDKKLFDPCASIARRSTPVAPNSTRAGPNRCKLLILNWRRG
jgi:hypothetical protein